MEEIEDFVTYEQAVTLKELGFDWKCLFHYDDEKFLIPNGFTTWSNYQIVNVNSLLEHNYSSHLAAPTLSQVSKWLREVKGLFINIWLCASGFGWVIEKYGSPNYNGTFVTEHDGESGDDEDSGLFTTYEKALSSGVDAALNIISNN